MIRAKVLARDEIAKILYELVESKSEAEKVAFGNLVRKHFKIDTKVCFAFRVDEVVLVTFPDQKADGVFERADEEEFYLE